ncbi:MAG TPA: Dabb family protein [Polyangiales bacterium]|nr:Dabb family protein [Polyangiales bacterium]
MIERYVFIRLKPEHATEHGRAEVRARTATLAQVPGVGSLAIGMPADAGARHAWDFSLVVRFDSLAAVERYLEHPLHVAYYQGFLEPRVQVIKAWNFEL